jgi:hypothetical protein
MYTNIELEVSRGTQVGGSANKGKYSVIYGGNETGLTITGPYKTLRKLLVESIDIIDEMYDAQKDIKK